MVGSTTYSTPVSFAVTTPVRSQYTNSYCGFYTDTWGTNTYCWENSYDYSYRYGYGYVYPPQP